MMIDDITFVKYPESDENCEKSFAEFNKILGKFFQ